MPTLKSPSVTSTTRLFFLAEKFFIACSYASCNPSPPDVAPPARRLSRTCRMRALSAPDVAGSSTCTPLA